MVHEGSLWHVAHWIMTVQLPATFLTALEVSMWRYSIDIASGCNRLGSLLMRTKIDQVIVAPHLVWVMLIGCPCRPGRQYELLQEPNICTWAKILTTTNKIQM